MVRKGLLSKSELQEFKKQQSEDFTGKREQSFADSLQFTNAAVASQIGNFAPTVSIDEKNLEVQKKQVELQEAMHKELIKANKKRGRSFRR